MNIARTVILWAADNRWLREHLPRYRFVRRSVARFMPGERLDDALAAATDLAGKGVRAAFTALGENVTTEAEADAVLRHYLEVYDRITEAGLDAEISVKPTHLGLDLDAGLAASHLERLAAEGEARGTWLWLDMESSRYVQPTVDLYRDLRSAHRATGICLQAYLRRTPGDIDSLMPLDPSIRLVKGAYREPDELIVGRRRTIDASYRALSLRMLGGSGPDGRIVLGTHDLELVRGIERDAAARGIARDAFEIEMLFGIRASDQVRLAKDGYALRSLIAYGTYWYPWFMRRIAEKPVENALLALRNLIAG